MEISNIVAFWSNFSCHFFTWIMLITIWRYVRIKDDIEACVVDDEEFNHQPQLTKKEIAAQEQAVDPEESYIKVTKGTRDKERNDNPIPKKDLELVTMKQMKGYRLDRAMFRSLQRTHQLTMSATSQMLGIKQATLYSWAQQQFPPRVDIVHRLASLFEVPVEHLVIKVKERERKKKHA